MAGYEGGDEEGEEEYCEGEDGEEIRVQADEGVDCEEGERVGAVFPGEETEDFGLEDEDYADAGVEAAEVGGHGGYVEGGTFDVGGWGGMGVLVWGEVFGGYYLLEESLWFVSM